MECVRVVLHCVRVDSGECESGSALCEGWEWSVCVSGRALCEGGQWKV